MSLLQHNLTTPIRWLGQTNSATRLTSKANHCIKALTLRLQQVWTAPFVVEYISGIHNCMADVASCMLKQLIECGKASVRSTGDWLDTSSTVGKILLPLDEVIVTVEGPSGLLAIIRREQNKKILWLCFPSDKNQSGKTSLRA
jgi:hypothetical protein